jgi:ABC-type lipoprotein export system ATPase subunit
VAGVVVTHDERLASLADRIVRIQDGRLDASPRATERAQ